VKKLSITKLYNLLGTTTLVIRGRLKKNIFFKSSNLKQTFDPPKDFK